MDNYKNGKFSLLSANSAAPKAVSVVIFSIYSNDSSIMPEHVSHLGLLQGSSILWLKWMHFKNEQLSDT